MVPNIDRDDRLAIWNSFFKLAWGEARAVFELEGAESRDNFQPTPEPLPDKQHHVMAAVVLCSLQLKRGRNI
jgi:hypothetical protein